MSELKPCPFCGGVAELQHIENRSFVECTVCGAQSIRYLKAYSYSSDDKATEAWNRRALYEQPGD